MAPLGTRTAVTRFWGQSLAAAACGAGAAWPCAGHADAAANRTATRETDLAEDAAGHVSTQTIRARGSPYSPNQ